MGACSVMILGVGAALAAAAETGGTLPDPTRPYAFTAAVEIQQDLPKEGVQWRLNGIRIHEDERSALLNGRIVRAGDSLNGAKVLEIHPAEVVLMQDSQRIVVKLILTGIKKPSMSAIVPQESVEN